MSFWNDALVHESPLALLACDGSGRILSCNRSFADFFGLAAEEVSGRLPTELGDLDLRRLLRAINASKEGTRTVARASFAFERAGVSRTLDVVSRRCAGHGQRPAIWISAIVDAGQSSAAESSGSRALAAAADLALEASRGILEAPMVRPSSILGTLALAWRASRAAIARVHRETGEACVIETAAAPPGENSAPFKLDAIPQPWLATLNAGTVICAAPEPARAGVPPAERRFLAAMGVERILIAPVRRAHRLEAVAVLVDPDPALALPPERQRLLIALSELTWAAFERRRDADRLSRLLAALDGLDDALAVIDAQGKILESNAAFRARVGQTSIAGQPLTSVCRLLAPEATERSIRAAMAREERWQRVLVASTDDGSASEQEWTIEPLGARSPSRSTTSWLVRGRDARSAADRSACAGEARRIEAVTQLAGGLAHEINTPAQYVTDNVIFAQESFARFLELIGAYRTIVRAIESGRDASALVAEAHASLPASELEFLLDEVPRALSQSREGLARIADVVGAMRDFCDPGSGEKAPVDVNRAVLETVESVKSDWAAVADIETELDPHLPALPCLPDAIGKIVGPLVTNAAQAIGSDKRRARRGRISIRTRVVEESVEIRVADDGPGIPDEIRARVFDPFFTTREVGAGSGKGLPLVRNVVVTQHEGEISLSSRPGNGTTVVVRLPLADRESNAAPLREEAPLAHAPLEPAERGGR